MDLLVFFWFVNIGLLFFWFSFERYVCIWEGVFFPFFFLVEGEEVGSRSGVQTRVLFLWIDLRIKKCCPMSYKLYHRKEGNFLLWG